MGKHQTLLLIKVIKFKQSNFFVRDGIFSVADYNSSRMGVVVVVVLVLVVGTFSRWDNLRTL